MNGGAPRSLPTNCSTAIHSRRSLPTGGSDGHPEIGWVDDVKTRENPLTVLKNTEDQETSSDEECVLDNDSHDSRMDVEEEEVGEKSRNGKTQNESHKRKLKDIRVSSTKITSAQTPRRKKRKRRRRILICTVNCKYDVVRQIAARFGMKEVGEDEPWNLYWTDLSVSVERAKEMKRFQKINHFPGMSEICRKDLLARNLNRMLKLFPKDYNFFPKTWCLPADFGEAISYSRIRRNRTYICKPETGCQGRGIFLTKNLKDIKPYDRMICQIYISKPLLVDGFKFDLRIYALITSCDPLRIFVYNEGLVRFATSRYKEPTQTNVSNVFMHLTNYAVNKHSRTYIVDDEAGSKRKISTLNRYFIMKNMNIKEIWSSIDDVIIKTVIAAHPMLKHSYHACFPSHDYTYACFELLGFDILLDNKLKPFILEVNHSPSFHTDSHIDRDVKENLLMDTFEILNLSQTDTRKVIEEDRRRVRERLLHGILNKDVLHSDIGNSYLPGKTAQEAFSSQIAWEEKHMGNFRCIYPSATSSKYEIFFHQNQSSLFQDTAASRAREECARMQRVELESKAKLEAMKRPGFKGKELLPRPESPKNKTRSLVSPNKKMIPRAAQKVHVLCSFEPDPILESEERERLSGLSQRDFLIRNYGILEKVYFAMLRNGTLRADDEKKYGARLRKDPFQDINPKDINVSHSQKAPIISKRTLRQKAARSLRDAAPEGSNKTMPNIYEPFINISHAGLKISSNNARIFKRPYQQLQKSNLKISDGDIRITRAHMARSYTNSMRLQEIEKREFHTLITLERS